MFIYFGDFFPSRWCPYCFSEPLAMRRNLWSGTNMWSSSPNPFHEFSCFPPISRFFFQIPGGAPMASASRSRWGETRDLGLSCDLHLQTHFTSFPVFPRFHDFFFKFQVVPLWRQRAGRDEEKLVIWDYHVIFISKPDERCLVFDLDSDLPFPTYFHKYVTETFRTDAILNPEYHRFFRVIPAQEFLQTFASDRRHMKKPDGAWMKPPPPYPCIMPTR